MQLTTLTSFAAILIEGDDLGGGFSASVYRDGVLHHTLTAFNEPARLPAGLGFRWTVEISGRVEVTRIVLAGSMEEVIG